MKFDVNEKWEASLNKFYDLLQKQGFVTRNRVRLLANAIENIYSRGDMYRLAEEYVAYQAELVGADQWPSSCLAWQNSPGGLMRMMLVCLTDGIEVAEELVDDVVDTLMQRYGFDATSVPPVLLVREYMGLMIQARKLRDRGPGCLCGPEFHAKLWGRIDKLAEACDRPEGAATVDRDRIMQILEDVL